MHYPSLPALIADRARALPAGPLCLILIEDQIAVNSTIRHHAALGFRAIIAFCAREITLPEDIGVPLHRVDQPVNDPAALPLIINAVSAATIGSWLYYCYNSEYLFFPFSEQRRIGEMLAFMAEERRASAMTYVIDLYARDLTTHPDAVDPDDAWFDGSGYFALAKQDATGAVLDRQVDIFGGLRWRFEEHIPPDRRRLDRVALFRAAKGLVMGPDRQFSDPEYNTYACPWHHSPTAAICSFRAAKALRRNPGSRHAIDTFHWSRSTRFTWQAQQLLDLGMMEPGQWF
ncbi:hypothetical protein [Yoonia sp.]|uniref:hypothetical protein n=1 Tax=Yoonia sp. TaxID=2212373 RepID=UPI003918B107